MSKAQETTKLYYADSVLKAEGPMLEGERHGLWLFYYPDGTKSAERELQAGRVAWAGNLLPL